MKFRPKHLAIIVLVTFLVWLAVFYWNVLETIAILSLILVGIGAFLFVMTLIGTAVCEDTWTPWK